MDKNPNPGMDLKPTSSTDRLLLPLLEATNELEINCAIEEIVLRQAGAVMRSAIRRKLHDCFGPCATGEQRQDTEDIYCEAVVSLIETLREYAARCQDKAIENLRGYAAMIAYHACDQYLRAKHPARFRLHARIRHVVQRHSAFATWSTAQGKLCGLAEWQPSGRRNLRHVILDPESARARLWPEQTLDRPESSACPRSAVPGCGWTCQF
jgi:DNA-directed RNA polymerase specialized sigma24 family protein